jgi:hypothetical protein
MKIETWLSPNCSEATFVVVDWKNKQVLAAWQETNESVDADGIASFISCIWGHLKSGDDVASISNGNGFHPELLDALKELKQEGVIMVDQDSPQMKAMADDLMETDKGYKEVIYKHTKSKVELLAEGFYGGKNGTKTSGRRPR